MPTGSIPANAIRWHFAKPGDIQRQRNSKLDEFFAGSGSDRAGDLVREGIQNAGDAARPEVAGPVRVSIGIGKIDADRAAAYCAGLAEHMADISKEKGMEAMKEKKKKKECWFLRFEDFNTTGLTGAPEATRRYDTDPPNAFHTFFRAEGQTDKIDEKKQGSKGVGKVTFLAASCARVVFGLTRREDGRSLMFGTGVLHTHRHEGFDYDGDAWFGRIIDGKIQPSENQDVLNQFREDFSLVRQPNEVGFSIVMPWLDTNDEDGITIDRLIDAVLRDQAWPILQNRLVVEITTADGALTTISASSFLGVLQSRIDAIKAAGLTDSISHVRPFAELTAWGIAHSPGASNTLGHHGDNAPKWSDPDLLSANLRDALRGELEAGEPIALRVPVRVKPKGRGVLPIDTYFDLFLKRDADTSPTPGPSVQFVRGGLLISGMGRKLAGVKALVVISDGGLAGFLRAAENPSHTKWNAKPIKDRYIYAPATLSFVVDSVRGLMGLLAGDPAEKDATIWANEMSLPAEDVQLNQSGGENNRNKRRKKTTTKTIVIQPQKKRPYDIRVIEGGFVIEPSGRAFPGALPAQLELQLAYHVRGKNPLKNWTVNDFDLTRTGDFSMTADGCELVTREPNRLVLRIDATPFNFEFTGFDTERELHCKPRLDQMTADDAEEQTISAAEGGAE